ncbi:DUF4386 domain-containing protein [Arenibacter algicola]|uniref:DUF4386 domain-containing protein n=1 Tax=Arenibacter algicola TaxID=616991 RepID=A0A221V289_9FLAO|nr:DUF4386 domain-containing protein [Arenibacter algicola]ASO07496.1 hypothetical protein AREALGSMS7_04091 [Arenibacter algicola]|tara:strand:- start:64146 stop:64841 length:696 start_codon:yes stop_codon:yes gene_type:complete
MDVIRKKSISVGALLILSIVVGILSIDPVIDGMDNLESVSINSNAILIRAFMQFILGLIYASIPIILYTLLKKINTSLTIGFLVFRIISVGFIFIGWLSILLLLALSQEFVTSGSPELLYFKTLDNLLRSGRDLINHVAMPLILSVGNLMFYYILYQSKIIPNWLSLWGLIATILSSVLASLLLMFDVIGIINATYVSLAFPTALLEIVLATWLIVKGFDSNVVNSISEKR